MDHYINDLMGNHMLETEYEMTACSDKPPAVLTGGAKRVNRPTGGFPPIYLCDAEEEKQKREPLKVRGFATKVGSVSIGDIMAQRKLKRQKGTPSV